ncbi:MAG: OmpA family protein [Ferrovum sp.]|nr:OmpA family protein [Ferrovum sp.]
MKPFEPNKNQKQTTVALSLGLAISTLALSSAVLAADQTYPAIVHSGNGTVVYNNYGECWGTGSNDVATEPTTECGQAAPVVAKPAPPPPAPAPIAQAEPAPAPVVRAPDITLSADALFDFDKSVLKPEGKAAIDSELKRTKFEGGAIGVASVKVVGNTDSIGTKAYNQKLSERRANAVKAYLVSKGVPAAKIHTEGHGELDPVASNKTKEGRAKNRRADIWFDKE